ncbi:Tim44 domain-containing protein [Rhodoplanes sp. Z2-YC6860]|uniref:Tim44 domain-containing protein n=1 Tax=Rhodoplanes sp. Z2-YC6860 TaxID=674703 RepID=UPI00078E42E0|nr:Tim44/TimA family putative adaptor protein [Rhodoplanes sp. Z2-YC6860]AMN41150.1 import inner membrane translocase subunit Tim44 [Rhodoplanes sp. Z2-YC6860]
MVEVEMPQDAESSGLISLLWAIWVYLNIYWWLDNLSSTEQTDKNWPQRQLFGWSGKITTIPSLAAAAVPHHLAALVSEILRRDGGGLVEDFLGKLLNAYETIVVAFESGDRTTLRGLVSADVYDALTDAMTVRESQQITIETVFSRLDAPEIVNGSIDEAHMEISVRFIGECFRLCRNAAGELVEGTDRYRNIEIWTFARAPSSRESAWRVVATEACV